MKVNRVRSKQSKAIARRNHGIYEPEFRLPLLILFALFSGFGYLGFGMGAQNQAHWSAPVISFGLIGFGATFGLTLGSAYLVDSFGDASSSALTAMTTMKVGTIHTAQNSNSLHPLAEFYFVQCKLLGCALDRDTYASLSVWHYCGHYVCHWCLDYSVGLHSYRFRGQ